MHIWIWIAIGGAGFGIVSWANHAQKVGLGTALVEGLMLLLVLAVVGGLIAGLYFGVLQPTPAGQG